MKTGTGSGAGIAIRPESRDDSAAIRDVTTRAFGGDAEASLVEALRIDPAFIPQLSLVGVQDGRVVAHVLFTRIQIRGLERSVAALALAPVAVEPELQRRGIGSALVRHGFAEGRQLGHRIVVVLGHATYYPRFGFVRASTKGIRPPFPARDESFMVHELVPGALDGVEGVVEYSAPFASV